MAKLDALVALVTTAPGLLGKRELALVKPFGGDGDDAAVIPHGDGFLVICGEAISPPFLRADPYGAGSAAVVTNVSDVRAMGARALGIVDMLVSPDRDHANAVLDGIRWASDRLGVPVVGGHLTLGHEPALSASATGFAKAPLQAGNAKPGDTLIAAFAIDGRYMSDDTDFFTALHDRSPAQLQQDGEALVEVAERRLCHAARDVSMPGIAGSLLQMIEGAHAGATLDVDAIPRPAGVPVERWLMTFPSFGFLLAAPPEHVGEAVETFRRRGLAAAPCGHFDATKTLTLIHDGVSAVAWDLNTTPLTGLVRSPSAGA
ncbi:MAG TPA: AIR synthase related protein [Solirubrobacter sp.]|nr:AIR synthase related protein [Solirubrobacter sp.]